ncbi:MAG: ArsR/SmtB family transcription factor [Solirubrobacterales bacterium]
MFGTQVPSPAAVTSADQAPADVVAVLQALSDPVRLEIVRQVAAQGEAGELSCGQLDVPVSKSTCSHHLKTLNCAGVTAEREEGTRKYIRLRRNDLERTYPGLIDSVLRAVASS